VEKGLISVIVPVYKAEEFLEECVDCILSQTYTNLEIILVNDGSPDDSGKLCDMMAKKDNRIRVVHKENGGVASARNAALDVAQGEFVAFADSDDTLDKDMYEELHKRIVETGADMCVSGYKMFYGDYERIKRVPMPIEDILSPSQMWEIYLAEFRRYYSFFSSLWNKLFTMSSLKENSVRFQEWLRTASDGWFVSDCISIAHNGITFVDITSYNYVKVKNPNSISGREGAHERRNKSLNHLFECMKEALPQKNEEIEILRKCQIAVSSMIVIHVAVVENEEPYLKLTRGDVATILRYSNSNLEKVSALTLYCLPKFVYRTAFRMYCKRTRKPYVLQ